MEQGTRSVVDKCLSLPRLGGLLVFLKENIIFLTPSYCLLPLQGLMFGYATDETEECMPLTIVLAHKLNAKMAELRRNGTLPWLRPDSKTQVELLHLLYDYKLFFFWWDVAYLYCQLFPQVTVQYRQDRGAMLPVRVHTIVISVQHDEDVCLEEMRDALKEKVIKAVVPCIYLDDDTIYHLQPSGRFVIGGPQVNVSECGFHKSFSL